MKPNEHPYPGKRSRARGLAGRAALLASALGLCATVSAAPTIQVVYPVGGATVEGVVNLRAFAYEGATITGGSIALIDTVKFFRKADSSVKILLTRIASTGEWSGAWNASSLASGPDTLVFRAVNNTGSTKTDSSIVVTLANGGSAVQPSIEVSSPAPGSTISGTVSIAFTSSAGTGSIATREFSLDGAPYVSTSGAASHSLNTVPLAEGSHIVRLRVTNSNGASAESRPVTYIVANLPTVVWKTPAGGSVVSGRLALDYAATPKGQATIATDSLFIDGHGFAALKAPSGPDTISIHALAEGAHAFEVKTWDSNGKTAASGPVTLQVHNGPWAFLTAPVGGTVLAGKAVLSYRDSAAAPATITADTLWIDGKASQALSLSGTDTLNTTAYLDGEHTLQVKATDNQGRSGASGLITVSLRNSPQAWLDSAFSDSTVSGTLVLRFRVSAVAPATVASREVSLDGAGYHAAKGDSTDTVDTRMLSEGAHTAQVKVTDSRGKTGLSRLVKFNVRNAPSIAVVGPSADAYVKGTVTVRLQARAVSPDTIAKVQVSVAGGAWSDAPTDSTFVLDTRDYKDGALRMQAKAIDGSGKSATTLALEVVVDNAAPKISYPRVAYPGDAPTARKGVAVLFTAQALDLGAGMDKDSAMVLDVDSLKLSGVLMHDDGKNGDAVAGDNVYSAQMTLAASVNGAVPFHVRGRDALGNDTTLTGTLLFDNRAPSLTLDLSPAPGNIAGALDGEVHDPRLLVQGSFSDAGGSGMASLVLVVRNDSGSHVNNSPDAIPLSDGDFRRVVELVPGLNRIFLIGSDRAGNVDTLSAKVTYVVPKETRIVGTDGGDVIAADGSGVAIPAGALADAKEVTVRRADPAAEPKPLDDKVRLLGVPHEFGPDGSVFPSPVRVTLSYTDADLDPDQDGKPNFDVSKLTIVFWNGSTWVKAGDATLDAGAHTLSVAVNHFTLFDIAEDASDPVGSLVGYWSRNPVPGNAEFVYRVPKPGSVSLSILDMAGDLAKQLIPTGTRVAESGSVRWDGSNVRGRFSGAGLYVYVFRYKSDDGTTEKLIRKPVGLVGK